MHSGLVFDSYTTSIALAQTWSNMSLYTNSSVQFCSSSGNTAQRKRISNYRSKKHLIVFFDRFLQKYDFEFLTYSLKLRELITRTSDDSCSIIYFSDLNLMGKRLYIHFKLAPGQLEREQNTKIRKTVFDFAFYSPEFNILISLFCIGLTWLARWTHPGVQS